MNKILKLLSTALLIPNVASAVALNPLLANIISNNGGDGVLILNQSNGNEVSGNAIGTNLAGSVNRGNGGAGVRIAGTSSNNSVGGSTLTDGNLIAYNKKGVIVGQDASDLSVNNSIVNNSIYGNTLPGIDLGNDGPTPNHAVNPAVGPNNFQNFPVLGGFTITNTGLSIPWTLHSVPSSNFLLQFFKNEIGDPEGKIRVFNIVVTTDVNGDANGVINIGGVPLNTPITATATHFIGEETLGDTSEFSTPLIYGVANPCVPEACNR
jgi:hypothetical protein